MAFIESRRVGVDLSGDDAVALDEDLTDPDGHGTFCEAAMHGDDPGDRDDYSRIQAGQDKAQSGDQSHPISRGQKNDEARHSDTETAEDDPGFVVKVIRNDAHHDKCNEAESVRDHGVELCFKRRKAELFDEGREEDGNPSNTHPPGPEHKR